MDCPQPGCAEVNATENPPGAADGVAEVIASSRSCRLAFPFRCGLSLDAHAVIARTRKAEEMQRVPLSMKKRLGVMNASKDLHEVLLDLAKGLEHARHPLPEDPGPVCQVEFGGDSESVSGAKTGIVVREAAM